MRKEEKVVIQEEFKKLLDLSIEGYETAILNYQKIKNKPSTNIGEALRKSALKMKAEFGFDLQRQVEKIDNLIILLSEERKKYLS